MRPENIWLRAREIHVETGEDIVGNFDIGFDKQIPEEVKAELRRFVRWVEEHFRIPVTLWVDFEYKHYLVSRAGKRVGYLFYWTDFTAYPSFDHAQGIPEIRLPVRTERYTVEEILVSFIEAISCYFAWISNVPMEGYEPNEEDAEDILQEYLCDRNAQ